MRRLDMTDIVETLREYGQEWYEMCADVHIPLDKAADEIENLRIELAIWKAKAPQQELDRFDEALKFSDRTDVKEHPYPRERLWAYCEDDLKTARAEIERLRGLLREWLEGTDEEADTYEERVRKALGDK